jgi:dihydrofolate reductase
MQLVVTQNITLDGVIEATGGWFSPAGEEEAVDVADIEDQLREQMKREDGLLLGRATFEQFRGYWPKQTEDTTGITDHLNRVHKYVFSTTLASPEWENTTVLRGPLRDEVETLRRRPGGDLGVTGSISVVRQLIDARLVDEYRLFVYPVVLGRGERLFAEGVDVPKLRLVGAKPFRSGIVLLTYRPA